MEETLRHAGKMLTRNGRYLRAKKTRSCGPNLPVSHPIIWTVVVFLSLSRLFLSPSHPLNEVLAESARARRDEKKTKCLLIRRLRVTALSHGITLISRPKNKKNISHGPWEPKYPDLFNAPSGRINAQAQSMTE